MNSKYSSILTIVLIVIIVAIIVILGFLGFKYYTNVISKGNADDFVDSFISDSKNNNKKEDSEEKEEVNTDTENDWSSNIEQGDSSLNGNSTQGVKYDGFNVAGTIEIPAINLKYPIIAKSDYSKAALEKSVVELYGDGLNKVGNTTIVGHNYRNGAFFSNNKKLNIGDKIYITDLAGVKLVYTIYEKYEVSDTESEYMTRDTQGAIEISLSTCTDDSKNRLLILAKAEG